VTSPGRAAPAPPPPDADDPRNRTLGIVLIAAAVLIGLVLLIKGFGQEDGLVSTGSADTDRTTTTTAGAAPLDPADTTTSTLAAKPPAEVTVLVANGSGKTGVAGTNADKLKSAGYTNVETTNASNTNTTAVYYVNGAQADAQAVATALGFGGSTVQAMPTPPPVQLGAATVLVVVGTDRA
jgi:hypothetical protein